MWWWWCHNSLGGHFNCVICVLQDPELNNILQKNMRTCLSTEPDKKETTYFLTNVPSMLGWLIKNKGGGGHLINEHTDS